MSKKTIITAALTGAATPTSINENIPITPQQIADDAYKCWKAGAAIVHLHMRDDNGRGIIETERFRETINLIRAHKDCDVVINCTSSGSMDPVTTEQRIAPFLAIDDIEMGSYDAGTMNWGCAGLFDNLPAFLEKLGQTYIDRGIKPEIEIFDLGMMGNVEYYVKHGSMKTPSYYQFVLGVLGGSPATPDNLMWLVRHLPPDAVWSAFGIGPGHLPIMYTALALGGNIRVGLEDNVYMSKGVKATNLALVERAVQAVRTFGNEPATSAEAREMLGIPQLAR